MVSVCHNFNLITVVTQIIIYIRIWLVIRRGYCKYIFDSVERDLNKYLKTDLNEIFKGLHLEKLK